MIERCVSPLFAASLLSLAAYPAWGQVGNQSRFTLQGPAEKSGTPVPRDALGRPCLDVEAASRAHVVNREMVDHIVSLKNNCLRQINAKVCYVNSDHCKDAVLQAYKRVDVILGTVRSVTAFRYSIIQK